MNYELKWADVTNHVDAGIQPTFLFERPLAHGDSLNNGGMYASAEVARLGTFWVPQTNLHVPEIDWAFTKTGQHVAIPIFGYDSVDRVESIIFWMGIQLGLQALDSLKTRLPRAKIVKTVMVLGNKVDTIPDKGYRGYLGLAFEVEE